MLLIEAFAGQFAWPLHQRNDHQPDEVVTKASTNIMTALMPPSLDNMLSINTLIQIETLTFARFELNYRKQWAETKSFTCRFISEIYI